MERYFKSISEKKGNGRNASEEETKESPWGRGGYYAARSRKIRKQAPKARTQILNGVTIYFTGVISQSQHRKTALQLRPRTGYFVSLGRADFFFHRVLTSTELTRMVHENGGIVSYGWARRSVTHVVADRLAASKIEKELQARGSNAWRGSIVKPEWLLSSIERGRKLPVSEYEVITSRQRQGGDLRKLLAPTATTRE